MIAPRRRFPICNPQRLEALFRDAGLAHVESRGIDVRTRFENFDDYCSPVIRAMNVAFRLRGQEFRAAIGPEREFERIARDAGLQPSSFQNVGRPWRVAIFRRAQLQQ